ncbi:unnamed protein product [Prunus armeniaca]|uniref:Uncharacterized protein n=1 Tax=Prunus armeniaca TaxID=36596 RepID=A0A6J5TC51_PRUAR|nr:unnamed protein product [Prunus armeniaca]
MASRAQQIVDDLNTTITNLDFERFDPPVLLAPTTVQDEFNLALGRPLVTNVKSYVVAVADVVSVADIVDVSDVMDVPGSKEFKTGPVDFGIA